MGYWTIWDMKEVDLKGEYLVPYLGDSDNEGMTVLKLVSLQEQEILR